MTNFDRLLQYAFEAGEKHGRDLCAREEGYHVPDSDLTTFEQWRATLSGLDTSEDLGPLMIGDTVTILPSAPDHLVDWRGRTGKVYLRLNDLIYINVPNSAGTAIAVPREHVGRAGA